MSRGSGDQTPNNALRQVIRGVKRYMKPSDTKPPKSSVYSSSGGSTGSIDYMLNPMTAIGDIVYGSTATTPSDPARLGIGATAQMLSIVAGLPVWVTIVSKSSETNCPLGTTIIDMGAISDEAIDYDVFVKIKTISGISHAQSRPRAVQLGGVGYEWYKDSGNLKIHIENDSNGSVTAISSVRKI